MASGDKDILAEFRKKEAALVTSLEELVECLRVDYGGSWLQTLDPALADLQALISAQAARSSKARIGSAIRRINRSMTDVADDVISELWTQVWDLSYIYQEAKYSTVD